MRKGTQIHFPVNNKKTNKNDIKQTAGHPALGSLISFETEQLLMRHIDTHRSPKRI